MKKVTEIKQTTASSAEKKKLRVAAYCRVSTDSDAQLESLDNQRSHYEDYIRARDDWEFAGVYFDEGITGTKKEKRPALQQMMLDCENHKIDFIITKSLSRFSRSTTDCLELVRRLQALNIPIFFERENLNTGQMESELILSILSSMAEGESASTSANGKWSAQKRFQNGTFKLAYPPYGYDWDKEKSEMVINSKQAQVVKQIFSDYLSGTGIHDIAASLNKKGIPTKKGAHWQHSTISSILTNEKYTGDVIFQKTYTDAQFNRHANTGEKDQYFCEGHHKAIISHEDFDRAAALLAQHCREKGILRQSEKYQNHYAFSGRIFCAECGGTMRRRIHSSGSQKYAAWLCNTHLADKTACSMLFIRNDALEMAFLTMMNKLIYARETILLPLLSALKQNSSDGGIQRVRELECELLRIGEQRDTLQRLMAQGYLDQVLFTQQRNELMAQADAFRTEIEMLQSASGKENERLQNLQKLVSFTGHSPMLETFDEEIFTEFADRIIIYSRREAGFVMKCGLTLRERM